MHYKILVTGGAGFIGSNIVHRLVHDGHRVTVIDNLLTGRMVNLKGVTNKIKFIKGDIRNLTTIKRAARGNQYILHQAALPSVPRSIADPLKSHQHNVNGTLNVFIAARDEKVKRVVFASSSSIYGNRKEYGPQKIKIKREAMKPMPLSPYAVNKLATEYYAKVFSHIYGLETVAMRYFNIFGPRQNPKSEYAAVIPKFITDILNNRRPLVHGDGKQTRDFTYIDNAVEANIKSLFSKKVGNGETINIACGDSFSLLQLIKLINNAVGKEIQPRFTDPRAGDVKHSKADISKAKKLIGYSPTVRFSEGVTKTINWFR